MAPQPLVCDQRLLLSRLGDFDDCCCWMPVPGSVRLGGSDVKRPDCGVTSRARMRENRRAIERDQIVAARDVADLTTSPGPRSPIRGRQKAGPLTPRQSSS